MARPFTGDYAGDLLYATLKKFDMVSGRYDACADDGLTLTRCRITNAVRGVPPENKPVGVFGPDAIPSAGDRLGTI